MNARAYEEIRQQLHGHERLLWTGYPRRGILTRLSQGQKLVIYPLVALVVLALALITFGAITHANVGALLFLAFAWFITYAAVGTKLVDALRRQFTVYALTNRRAIVISGISDRTVRSVYLDKMTTIELFERADHIGTIRCISMQDGWYRKNRRGEIKPIPLFRGIVDPRHVYAMLPGVNQVQPDRLVGSPPAIPDGPNPLYRIDQD
jgi:hypothetical protein